MVGSSLKEIFILFGALFAFVLVFGKLAEKKQTPQSLLMGFLLFNLGLYQLISYSIYCSPPIKMIHVADWDYLVFRWGYVLEAVGFMIFLFYGPIKYGYCLSVVNARFPMPKTYLLHFFPGAAYFVLYLAAVHEMAGSAVASGYSSLSFTGHDKIYLISIFMSVISFDSYMAMSLKKIIPLLSEYPKRNTIFKIITGTVLCSMIIVSFWPVDIIFNLSFTDEVRIFTSFYLITLYSVSRRYPERMIFLNSESERNVYMKSQLQGMNVESVIAQLNSLVQNEKIYKEDISLKELSGRLNVRQHQLSEILNAYMKTTYSNYLNDLRICEAERLLKDEHDLQIIEISLEVGYNSLSVFYREFRKRTGRSPAEYRRGKTVSIA